MLNKLKLTILSNVFSESIKFKFGTNIMAKKKLLQAVKHKMTRKIRDLKASTLISVQITMLPVTVRGVGVHWGRMFTICGEKIFCGVRRV
jgi:hypothetical protein